MRQWFIALFAALFFACPVEAQTVQQSGTVTPGHATCWTTNGVVQDCGTAATAFLTSLGVVGQGNILCANSGPLSGPANQICFSVTNTALSLNFNNLNGATGNALICVNGTCSGINSANHIVVGVRSTNVSPVVPSLTSDYFLCLDSTLGPLAVNLPAAPPTGLTYLLKDCTGQAAVNPITITPASGTIDGQTNVLMSVPYQSLAVTYTGAQWSQN